ncbi:hypothetical protein [Dialister hominis]|uniref:hypothetical protein n=1 Tax=Dialister hominis TaxID=2582419 RepID=UPI003AAB5CE0
MPRESTSSCGYWTARTMEGCFFCSSSDAQTVAPLPWTRVIFGSLIFVLASGMKTRSG